MDRNITILAVTKLGDEICVAGIDEDNHWIRPTCDIEDFRQFNKADIYDKNNKPVVALSNQVAIWLRRAIPQTGAPHIEDWEYDMGIKPILIRTLNDSQRLALFQKIAEQSLDPVIIQNVKSLCLIEPTEIVLADFANISAKGKYQPKLKFTFCKEEFNYKVTDIYWRALGRLLATKHKLVLDGKELRDTLKYSRIFLTVGLTRMFEEKYWPMVVGIHTVPYFPVQIDYNNL